MAVDEPDILMLRVEQIDHMTLQDVNLIQQLSYEAVSADSIPDRTLEWLSELGVITVDDDGYAQLRPDGVVFDPIVSPNRDPDEVRYGGYNRTEELKDVELPPDREPRSDE
ncbi:hypothetical protein [Haloarchaeobius sp. TZWSO28]|uniref:hypothetical protein n=1 Tax=Haloarchaeobius sp. TZWSO28 TaxID=3446119 RepID=UPI003EBF8531